MTDTSTSIGGTVAPGYEPVAEAFARNFSHHGDVGAALCVYRHGEVVADLWGGVEDPATGTPYGPDTLQLVFSSTKGATALCANLLAQRGELDLDAPVVRYWPEFGAEGKAATTVRDLLSHRAGLAAFAERISIEDFIAWDPAVERLAAQAPNWEPGTAHGYHALTFGHLVGEVVRRATGRTLGRWFADEVAAPLGLDFHIGLPPELEPRVAPLFDFVAPPRPSRSDEAIASVEAAAPAAPVDLGPLVTAMITKGTLTYRVFTRPPLRIPRFNEPAVREAEIPAANGITNARSLARMYASIVGDGVDGVRLLDPAQVDDARQVRSEGDDLVLIYPNRIGTGFFLSSPSTPLTSPGAFGHSGMGGSLGFADPELELGFGYVMNQAQQHPDLDPRTHEVVRALKAICLPAA
jgi:CubicO group peptidase (beta-lactamase class C family)